MIRCNVAFVVTVILASPAAFAGKITTNVGFPFKPNEQMTSPHSRAYSRLMIETNPQALTAFELSINAYWSASDHFQASVAKTTYQGLGLHMKSGGFAANLGLQIPIEKYQLDELRYSQLKYITGLVAYFNWDDGFAWIDYRHFQNARKSKQKIDSYEVEFKPAAYHVVKAELSQDHGPLSFSLVFGRYSPLKGTYHLVHIIGPITHRAVGFFQTKVMFKTHEQFAWSLAYHDCLNAIEPDRFYPVIGYRLNEDVLKSGVLGFEVSF